MWRYRFVAFVFFVCVTKVSLNRILVGVGAMTEWKAIVHIVVERFHLVRAPSSLDQP